MNLSTQQRRRLMARFLERTSAPGAGIPRRADGAPPCGLSFAQEQVWVAHQLEGADAVYNSPLGLRLEGRLDAAALEAALNEILRRHGILRSSIRTIDGRA